MNTPKGLHMAGVIVAVFLFCPAAQGESLSGFLKKAKEKAKEIKQNLKEDSDKAGQKHTELEKKATSEPSERESAPKQPTQDGQGTTEHEQQNAANAVKVVETNYPELEKGDVIIQVNRRKVKSEKEFTLYLRNVGMGIQQPDSGNLVSAWVLRDDEVLVLRLKTRRWAGESITLEPVHAEFDLIPFAICASAAPQWAKWALYRVKDVPDDSNLRAIINPGDFILNYDGLQMEGPMDHMKGKLKGKLAEVRKQDTVPIVILKKVQTGYDVLTVRGPRPKVNEAGQAVLGLELDIAPLGLGRHKGYGQYEFAKISIKLGEPITRTSLLDQAKGSVANGNFDKGKELLRAIVNAWPDSEEAKEAKKALADASENTVGTLFSLAERETNAGDYNGARATLIRIIKGWPGTDHATKAKEMVRNLKGTVAKANARAKKEAFQKAFLAAKDLWEIGEVEEALKQLRKALEVDPEAEEAKELLAQISRATNQKTVDALVARAEGNLTKGDLHRAAVRAAQALELIPDDTKAKKLVADIRAKEAERLRKRGVAWGAKRRKLEELSAAAAEQKNKSAKEIETLNKAKEAIIDEMKKRAEPPVEIVGVATILQEILRQGGLKKAKEEPLLWAALKHEAAQEGKEYIYDRIEAFAKKCEGSSEYRKLLDLGRSRKG